LVPSIQEEIKGGVEEIKNRFVRSAKLKRLIEE